MSNSFPLKVLKALRCIPLLLKRHRMSKFLIRFPKALTASRILKTKSPTSVPKLPT